MNLLTPRRAAGLLAALLVLLTPTSLGGTKLKLKKGIQFHVQETAGLPRTAEPVTFSFPLRKKDKVKDTKDLVVLAPGGDAVPSQMRAIQRWKGDVADPNRDIRWVLIDAQVDVSIGSTASYTIKRRQDSDPKEPDGPTLDVVSDAAGVHVDTGTARFRISGTTANFLDLLMADIDGDGVVEDGEELIDQPAGAGFVLTDRFGATYSSAASPVTLTIEEEGPLRAVVRADGLHEPVPAGSGIDRDFFQFRTRYTFYAGKPWVRVQHTVRNAYVDDPLGSIGFEAYALHTSLDPGAKMGGPPFFARYGLDDDVPLLLNGASRLYQDSDGGPKWNQSPGTTFPGFTVRDASNVEVGAGDQASGYMHVRSGSAAVTLFMRDWFENFPKGLAFDGGTGLRFDVFPAEFGTWHYLDDAQQKTTDFFVVAHGANGPLLGNVLKKLDLPLRPYPDPAWTMKTEAWGDHGDLDPNIGPEDFPNMLSLDQQTLDGIYTKAFDHNGSFEFGWSEFGELVWAKNTHTTGSPRNRLSYFHRFIQTGSYPDFRVNELFALHSRDLRTYHLDGFTLEDHPDAVLWEGMPPWTHSDDKLGRDSLDPALDPHRAGIPQFGHGWNGFDMEHMVADDLYEHYVLTGDHVTLDSLQEMGECVRTWPIYSTTKSPGSTRGVGWTLRALIKIWQVTGDERFLQSADDLVHSVWKTYGKRHKSPITNKKYGYVTRYLPHANHIADAEYDLPWQQAVTIHGLLLHHAETGSKYSRKLAIDVAKYIVKYGWNGSTVHEALAVDDHKYVNPKADNTGINTWIPSALALTWREAKKKKAFLKVSEKMFESIPSGFYDPNHYLGYGLQHWWLSYKNIAASKKKE